MLAPALTLVAPVGMDEEAQATWFAAAYMALSGYSGREIAQGVKTAMRKADHPSKVVPTIVKEIEAMEHFSRDTGNRGYLGPVTPALPQPKPEPIPHDETQAILRAAGLNLSATRDPSVPTHIPGGSPDRGARLPSRADYIRMGVDPAVLDAVSSGTEAGTAETGTGSVHDGPSGAAGTPEHDRMTTTTGETA